MYERVNNKQVDDDDDDDGRRTSPLAGGCFIYDATAWWSDMTWSNVFYLKFRKEWPIGH